MNLSPRQSATQLLLSAVSTRVKRRDSARHQVVVILFTLTIGGFQAGAVGEDPAASHFLYCRRFAGRTESGSSSVRRVRRPEWCRCGGHSAMVGIALRITEGLIKPETMR